MRSAKHRPPSVDKHQEAPRNLTLCGEWLIGCSWGRWCLFSGDLYAWDELEGLPQHAYWRNSSSVHRRLEMIDKDSSSGVQKAMSPSTCETVSNGVNTELCALDICTLRLYLWSGFSPVRDDNVTKREFVNLISKSSLLMFQKPE